MQRPESKRLLLIVVAFLILIPAACNKTEHLIAPNACVFSGVTRTDEIGALQDAITDDWCPLESGDTSHAGLLPAYPNPTLATVTIRFQIPASGQVRIVMLGPDCTVVRSLVQGQLPAGVHEIVWDGFDDGANELPAGVYRCLMRLNGILVCYGDIELQ